MTLLVQQSSELPGLKRKTYSVARVGYLALDIFRLGNNPAVEMDILIGFPLIVTTNRIFERLKEMNEKKALFFVSFRIAHQVEYEIERGP